MKRWFLLLLCSFLLLSLAACGKGAPSTPTEDVSDGTTASGSTSAEPNGQRHTLVVYFSATGNTRQVAEVIAAETGGDIFEITPADAYTDGDLSWSNADSRVCREHDDQNRSVPLTTVAVPNWENCDTVYIGYPIWWGGAAFPVEAFVKATSFTGKAVIPFCTSASSRLGNSAKDLAALCGTGSWQTGQRFSSSVDAATVRKWVAAQ